MGTLKKILQYMLLALYVFVVFLLCYNTWWDYSHGVGTLRNAILQTVLLVGLPFWVVIGAALPELAIHLLSAGWTRLFSSQKQN